MAFAAFLLRLKARRRWIPAFFAVVYTACILSTAYAQSSTSSLPNSNKIKIGFTITIDPIKNVFCKNFQNALAKTLKESGSEYSIENDKKYGIVNNQIDSNSPRYQALIEDNIEKRFDIECGTNSESSKYLIYRPRNKEYSDLVDFSNPFYETKIRLLLNKGLADELNKLDQKPLKERVKKLTIGVLPQTTTERIIQQEKINGNIYDYKVIKVDSGDIEEDTNAKYNKISEELNKGSANGGIDALASDGIILKGWLTKELEGKPYDISPNKRNFSVFDSGVQQYVLVLRKNSNLTKIVNDTLRRLGDIESKKLTDFEYGMDYPLLVTPTVSPSGDSITTNYNKDNLLFEILIFIASLFILFLLLTRFFSRIKQFILRRTHQPIKTPPTTSPPETVSELSQRKQRLQEALIEAFPDLDSLEQMLEYRLDKNLQNITGNGNLNNVVFKLIKKANAEGWLNRLVEVAHEENPGNEKLQASYKEFFPAERNSN